MRTSLLTWVLALPLALTPALAQPSDAERDKLAEHIVTQSAHVQAGDLVLISGSPRDLGLLEDLAVHVRRQGAFPLLTVNTDRMTRRMYDDVPEEYDTARDEMSRLLMEHVDVMVEVDGGDTPDLLAHVDPARFAKRSEANQPTFDLFRTRGIRFVNVGNELYPAAYRAERAGMKQADLARLFWDGVGADTGELGKRAQAVHRRLDEGREVHITHPNGTDLRFRIEDRTVRSSDGSISDEDRKAGNTMVWLPAGDVYVTPVPGSAQGTLVADRVYERGQAVEGVELTFEDGKIASMSAESGLDHLKARYDAGGEGRDAFAYLNIGVNPQVKAPEDGRLTPWMADGMVTVGIGENVWAGGENRSSYGRSFHLPGATVTVDGKPLVSGGSLDMASR